MLVRQHAREIGLRSGEFTEAAPGVAAEGEAPSAAQVRVRVRVRVS